MAIFSFLPNRGARFGHQFFELALIRGFAQKFSGKVYLPNSLESNSKRFGQLFNPSDLVDLSAVKVKIDLQEFHTADQFESCLQERKILLTDEHVHFIACFQKVSWLSDWIRRTISAYDVYSALESTALYLKSSLVLQGKIPVEKFNRIAVHIRRENVSEDLNSSRFVPTNYYINILSRLIGSGVCAAKNIDIYSTPDFDSSELDCFEGLTFRQHLDEVSAFCELANHSYLIGSPSGFSYTAHLVASSRVLIHPKDWNPYYSRGSTRNLDTFLGFLNECKLD